MIKEYIINISTKEIIIMIKKITLITALFIGTTNFINADEISMDSDGTIMEFNYLTVTDPQNFMLEVDKFDKSQCAKKWRDESNVAVSLWSLRGSGSTHFILVVYENADMMQKGRAIFNSCKESNLNYDKPNVILIMADDLGYEAIGINGADEYKTPVLDSLALNGINFNNAYSQPLCTVSYTHLTLPTIYSV